MSVRYKWLYYGIGALAPFLTAVAAILYLSTPPFALVVNGLGEMLYTGGVRGVMMYYYSAGDQSSGVAIAATALVVIAPVFKSAYLWSANLGYFGQGPGTILSLAGSLIGGMYLFSWGTLFEQVCFKVQSGFFKRKNTFWASFAVKLMAGAIALLISVCFWQGFIALVAGVCFGKFMRKKVVN